MNHQIAPVPAAWLRPDGTPMRVLVVDDEPDGAYVVRTVLRYEGWQARSAADGADAVALARKFRPDAVVLDVLLPDADGLEVARRIRVMLPDVCVLFLTACDPVAVGIPAGDAYLTKPVGLDEVLTRLQSMLRHVSAIGPCMGATHGSAAGRLAVGDLVMDEEARTASRGGELVDLHPDEFALLRLLMRNPRRVLGTAEILDQVWPHGFGSRSHEVEMFIDSLKQKIDVGPEPLIHAVPGVGYVLAPGQQASRPRDGRRNQPTLG